MTTNPTTAEARLVTLGIKLPAPPEPFGTYAEAVTNGQPAVFDWHASHGRSKAKFIGRVGGELMWQRVAGRLTSRRLTLLRLRDSTWDRSIK